MPPFQSAPSLVVLHTLRVAGRAPTSTLLEVTGLPPNMLKAELDAADAAGTVAHHNGLVPGCSLTPSGRSHHIDRLDDERRAADRETEILAGYDDLVAMNDWFKSLCTEWQLQDHPRSCVERLQERHRHVDAMARRLGRAITRFNPYAARFECALERLRTGDSDAFTTPLAGSYHDVWMHLHEDLLLTLGRERSPTDGA
ncbi:MAG: hypothetical protein H0W46_00175 [Acidimicrobiia bacterium]|nr:hypothetical protein [Acidimicrobiia bacterium]